MKRFTDAETAEFVKAPHSQFVQMRSGDKKIVLKTHLEEGYDHITEIVALNPVPVSMIQMWRLFSEENEVGLLIDVPNLPYWVGGNYVTVKRKTGLQAPANPTITAHVNKLLVLEVPDEALTLLFDNTGNFQT